MNKLVSLTLALSCLTIAACDGDEGTEGSGLSKAEAAAAVADDKADGIYFDYCELFDWYGDGICDEFCLEPDPDCGDEGPALCGGIAGWICDEGEYCRFEDDQTCGAADQLGTCETMPEICIEVFAPVCGCDGNTYGNECFAAGAGVSVAADGPCEEEPASCNDGKPLSPFCDVPPLCEPGLVAAQKNGCWDCVDPDTCEPPVVGSGDCGGLLGMSCEDGEFCDWQPGEFCGAADHLGTCKPTPEVCIQVFAPVCGCDGQTYSNGCVANAAGVSVASDGACE